MATHVEGPSRAPREGDRAPGRGWRFLVDRGGTFTDVIGLSPEGALRVLKTLSVDAAGEDATAAALRRLAGPELATHVESVRLGTTVATNALLERKGARLALATTLGFGDVLLIGTQARPELFSLHARRPPPLPSHVLEIDERILVDGQVRRAPDPTVVREQLRAARAAGCDALAVALVHAWVFPEHERLVGELALEAGFGLVVLSSECDPHPGLLARAETTAVDAYVSPPLRSHVARLQDALGRAPDLRLMTSGGGVVTPAAFRGRDAVLSGPAGGAVALARVAREAGCDQALGLDMGGTSTDVSRWSASGDVERSGEREIASVRLRAPMVDVVTVAAGGGSILSRLGGRLVAGPESAGARPGPACYREGGPATVTDANVALGRVQPAWFPRCFGRSRSQQIDPAAARARLAELGVPLGLAPDEVALGAFRVANEAMARALRQVSVARGLDPSRHALVAFGGAAPQHACALADLLGMRRVLVHPLAGVLSAFGMGLADARADGARALLLPLDASGLEHARVALDALEHEQSGRLATEGIPAERRRFERILEIRHRGVEATLPVPAAEGADARALREAFEAAHERLFGFRRSELEAEIVAARVEGRGALEPLSVPGLGTASEEPRPVERVRLTLAAPDGSPHAWDVPLFRRATLLAGHAIEGPALVADETFTLVIDPGWRARVHADGLLDLERSSGEPVEGRGAAGLRAAVRLEVLGSRFMGIAEQMGESLRRTAQSPNIRDRLDYSCAIFTKDGRLVANAPHVPVHLGAMGATVRALMELRGEAGMRKGIALASNDPHRGGSHLPDITVVSPVVGGDGRLRFFVANRGHHADVGGITPGSMPPFATDISQEGVLLHDVLLADERGFREDEVAALMAAGAFPVRGIPERLADLRAQVAANVTGTRLLLDLCREEGAEVVRSAMDEVLADAAAATRELLESLPGGTRRFGDVLDDGSRIEVALTIEAGRARFDFTGTSPQHPGSLNAPQAVVRAAVMYVLRCLLGRDVPLNDGVLEPVEIVVPPGTLLSPGPSAAVCGGNVETSMRIADVLLAAFGAQAASQGTMNNLTFGNSSFAYYETIGGGAGAGPGFDGASAVHSHLTNTRITDVEILERRAPVVVRELSVRRGSGGAGRYRGGDGITRAIELRRRVSVAILSERRVSAPFGLSGGRAGALGRNRVERASGQVEQLGGRAEISARSGDVVIIETPGGGGWGEE